MQDGGAELLNISDELLLLEKKLRLLALEARLVILSELRGDTRQARERLLIFLVLSPCLALLQLAKDMLPSCRMLQVRKPISEHALKSLNLQVAGSRQGTELHASRLEHEEGAEPSLPVWPDKLEIHTPASRHFSRSSTRILASRAWLQSPLPQHRPASPHSATQRPVGLLSNNHRCYKSLGLTAWPS